MKCQAFAPPRPLRQPVHTITITVTATAIRIRNRFHFALGQPRGLSCVFRQLPANSTATRLTSASTAVIPTRISLTIITRTITRILRNTITHATYQTAYTTATDQNNVTSFNMRNATNYVITRILRRILRVQFHPPAPPDPPPDDEKPEQRRWNSSSACNSHSFTHSFTLNMSGGQCIEKLA